MVSTSMVASRPQAGRLAAPSQAATGSATYELMPACTGPGA